MDSLGCREANRETEMRGKKVKRLAGGGGIDVSRLQG